MKDKPGRLVISVLAVIRNVVLLVLLYVVVINTEVTLHYNGAKGVKYFIEQIEQLVKGIKFVRSF